MNTIEVNTVNQAYGLLTTMLSASNIENHHYVNNTVELLNIVCTIDDIKDPIAYYRNISLPYLLGELVWYFSGSNDVNFISKFGSIWKKLSDDGKTNNSAYGYILKNKHGFDQVQTIIQLLKKDKESRRALLNINVPNKDVITTKDEPCTIGLQFIIRNEKLHMTAMMRSNDIWFGFPYDVVYFTTIQKYIARELGIEVGRYTHFATSLHMYIKDVEKIGEAMLMYDFKKHKPRVLIDYLYIVDHAEELYKEINAMANPKEEILEYFINKGIVIKYTINYVGSEE